MPPSVKRDLDITDVLTGANKTSKKQRIDPHEDPEDDLADLLATKISKRNVKDGTKVVKKSNARGNLVHGQVGGGSFQSMGLHPSLLRSLTLQGFRVPTPIQRLAIPSLLENPPRDLVGMARTGSGKSLAFILPLIQRLGGRHSTSFGARALILLPTRELALQLFRVGKSMSRGFSSTSSGHAGDRSDPLDADDNKSSSGQGLKWGLVVGGEGLDEQFEMIASNPDVIIATPGRLLHVVVEMNLDLKSVQYVVFDEADRLFEMGFETALTEILSRLPSSRQSLLFSATLPKSLVEFAKAGLENPKLVRLDAESKISTDLRMAFFSVKSAEKDACLFSLLRDVIRVPYGTTAESDTKGKQRANSQSTLPHQTLIFVATKHHVEYLTNLLTSANYSVSHIYGSLDQTARSQQMDSFRRGLTNILVVTDVAARGIDIPVLENVVNYDFPHGARVFVHRVGRTARAGRKGWAWSMVTHTDMPYLLDLQLFLGRPITSSAPGSDAGYTESLVLGTFERERIDQDVEYIRVIHDQNHSLESMKAVMKRGHAMYERSKGKASPASYQRAKDMSKDAVFMLAGAHEAIHPILLGEDNGGTVRVEEEAARRKLLEAVSAFRPNETILEAGSAKTAQGALNAELMKERRKALGKSRERAALNAQASTSATAGADEKADADEGKDQDFEQLDDVEVEMADEEDIAAVFDSSTSKKKDFRDGDFYMSHYQKDADTDKGYSLRDGASFIEQAQLATFDLAGDEGNSDRQHRMKLSWDKKKKKFVQGGGVGADNVKLVKTESGVKLPATYRSGRFDEWKQKSHRNLPKVGETEESGHSGRGGGGGRRFRHNKQEEAKPLDKMATTYERKLRRNQARDADDGGEGSQQKGGRGGAGRGRGSGKPGSRYGGKPLGRVKSELKTKEQIHKTRKVAENRKAKNARPSRGGKGGGRGGGGGGGRGRR
ncbi:P-loop containing nucleoside triphosphate hydrolase protein [Pterulicium gracile]|uniref:RNA helicase n=1 Tax=Pterulicium gracile TaxID=1884261 RepID=A0A5C3QV84_9AGAR|nr:P-loop containing nucleoside triphosphate hydrolase protein [Pterula gracilis]